MKENMFYGAGPLIFRRAEDLRKNMTSAEKIIWNHVHINEWRLKFRRQHPISNFVVDFYCHPIKLVIEIDGDIHSNDDVKKNDRLREKTLKDLEGKIDEEQVKKANDAKDALKAAIEKGELEDIKAKKDELQTIVQELTTKLYEEAAKQAQAQQEGAEGAQKADDNVVDAEYEEVNDDQEKK